MYNVDSSRAAHWSSKSEYENKNKYKCKALTQFADDEKVRYNANSFTASKVTEKRMTFSNEIFLTINILNTEPTNAVRFE